MRANTLPRSAIAVPRNLLATRYDRGSTIAYLRALTLTVWFGTLVYSYWWRKEADWMVQLYEEGVDIKGYYYVGFAIVMAGHLTLGLQKWISAPFSVLATVPCRLLTIFCGLMLLLSPFSPAFKTSAMYAVATWLVLLLCHMFWVSDYNVVRRVLVFTGLLLFAWLFILLFHHGLRWGFGSSIGSINRNTTSTVALGALSCCALSPKKAIRWGAIGMAAFFAVVVTSRGSMLALFVFVGVYYALHKGTIKAATHVGVAAFMAVAILLVSTLLQDVILEQILHVHDKDRGVGTGFTGRWDLWKHGLAVFWESPLFGHGFRAAAGGEGVGKVHSGYIKLLVESGVIGTGLILSAVGIELLQRVTLSQQLRTLRPIDLPGIDIEESLQINTVACATLCTVLTLWLYEPLYINLGSVISVMFFMMIAAPRFVSMQQLARR